MSHRKKSLLETQRVFQALITCPISTEGGSSSQVQENQNKGITETGLFSEKSHLDVYQNAYWIRMQEEMEEDYSFVFSVVGKEEFSQLVQRYFSLFPSQYTTIAEIGRFFPTFLIETEVTRPFLADLAQLEWLFLLNSSFILQEEPVSFSEIFSTQEKNTSSILIQLRNSVSLFSSKWDLSPFLEEEEILPGTTPLLEESYFFIYRELNHDNQTKIEEISKQEWSILERLKSPIHLEQLGEVLEEMEISVEDCKKWFFAWGKKGILTSIKKEEVM